MWGLGIAELERELPWRQRLVPRLRDGARTGISDMRWLFSAVGVRAADALHGTYRVLTRKVLCLPAGHAMCVFIAGRHSRVLCVAAAVLESIGRETGFTTACLIPSVGDATYCKKRARYPGAAVYVSRCDSMLRYCYNAYRFVAPLALSLLFNAEYWKLAKAIARTPTRTITTMFFQPL